jgi:hypothetical protein
MSRLIKTIEIEGKPAKALFDTGAFHSYLLRMYLEDIPDRFVPVTKPYEVGLGGETFEVREHALINGKIEGLDLRHDRCTCRFARKSKRPRSRRDHRDQYNEPLGNHFEFRRWGFGPGRTQASQVHRILSARIYTMLAYVTMDPKQQTEDGCN